MTKLHPLRVLYVEDDPQQVYLAQVILQRACDAYRRIILDHAGSLTNLGEKLNSGTKPEVCLLDLHLPNGDGIESVRKARAVLGPDIPLIAYTAMDYNEDEIIAMLKAGADNYVRKGETGQAAVVAIFAAVRIRSAAKAWPVSLKWAIITSAIGWLITIAQMVGKSK